MLRPSVRPASLITKQIAAPMIGAAGPWAPVRAAPTTIAEPERERPREVEDEHQHGVEARQHGYVGGHVASQADVATTSVSTPVLSKEPSVIACAPAAVSSAGWKTV
jgi:hypothetical protein